MSYLIKIREIIGHKHERNIFYLQVVFIDGSIRYVSYENVMKLHADMATKYLKENGFKL
ncbi:hypothetical protein G210_1218 [Candida maltosa Xu316]|uniref:Uncharacterized protein n=1 Tax=Candida maltosa (strain Xu316) TaxID=1245528 RepID=M3JZ07_CANMX|nr:hypothetical protein G210_1218 [Candida maltosa Xu316]